MDYVGALLEFRGVTMSLRDTNKHENIGYVILSGGPRRLRAASLSRVFRGIEGSEAVDGSRFLDSEDSTRNDGEVGIF